MAHGISKQTLQTGGGGGGSGTVTDVSVTTANGVSGSVATATTTPAISLTLGAITPTSVAASGNVTGSNLSGTNTGDNSVNTLYSGLAASKQDTLTLTTTGTSGAATLVGATLNIPQYSGGGGGTSLTYSAISTSQSITYGNFYGVDCTSGEVTLTLSDGTTNGQALTIKKLDSSSNDLIINGKVDGDTQIIMSVEDESIDLFWNGTTYLIN